MPLPAFCPRVDDVNLPEKDTHKETLGMRTLGIALFITIVASALPAVGQEKVGKPIPVAASGHSMTTTQQPPMCTLPTGSMPITPEMWFYEQQLREYLNPKLAVRRNAEFRSNQRRHRLASMRWFGFSGARPRSETDPWNGGGYGASWVSSSELHPYSWSGAGWSTVMTGVR